MSHHSGELFLVSFLLRCHARGAQVRRYAGSWPNQRTGDDRPLYFAARL